MDEPPLCKCHGEPKQWSKVSTRTSGGFWRCRVNDLARKRARYDADPVYRISKNLHDKSLRRTQTLNRMKEGIDGAL